MAWSETRLVDTAFLPTAAKLDGRNSLDILGSKDELRRLERPSLSVEIGPHF